MNFEQLNNSIEQQHSTCNTKLEELKTQTQSLHQQLLLNHIQKRILKYKLGYNRTKKLFDLGQTLQIEGTTDRIYITHEDIAFCKNLSYVKVIDDGTIPYVEILEK